MFKRSPQPSAIRRALGIDIGAHAIKTVLLEETTEGLAVGYAASVPTVAGGLVEGAVVKKREVAAQVQRLVAASGQKVREAALSLPGEQVLVRWIDLPRMDREALRAAGPFEARKYIAYPVEQADVELIPAEHGHFEEGRMRALLTVVPRAVLESRAETLEMAGLNVAGVEIEPFVLLRALDRQDRRRGRFWRGQSLGYMQIGEEASGIYLVQERTLRFVRAISWGSERLTGALAEDLGCTHEEAQRIRTHPSACLDRQGRFSWQDAHGETQSTDALAPELERLRRETERLMNYYRSLFPERSYEGVLGQLILCGGTARLKGLDRYFTHALQIETVCCQPFQQVLFAERCSDPQAIREQGPMFAIAHGLALGALWEEIRAEQVTTRLQEFYWRRSAA